MNESSCKRGVDLYSIRVNSANLAKLGLYPETTWVPHSREMLQLPLLLL